MPLMGKAKVATRDYHASGRFPIVDQGQTKIAGWTDDESAVIDSHLPLIVFGDHTRVLKYVDFPFARGADGTQLLKPKTRIDPLFFYYACRALDLPGRGYNRHFSLLKESAFSYPSDEGVQVQIGCILREIEVAIDVESELTTLASKVKKAAMRDLFTRGLRGEPQKDTEAGTSPESWKVDLLGAHHRLESGGTPSRARPEFWEGGTIPWVKTTEIDYGLITKTEEQITPAGLEASAAKLLPAGTLLLAMYGQGVTRGKVAMLGIEATCNQACAAIRPTDEEIQPRFLFHFLTYRYDILRQLSHGGQQQNLNLNIVRSLPLAYPSTDAEQGKIVEILDTIDRKIALHSEKKAVLEGLFKALLHTLMTGEVRTSDLDLAALVERSEAVA
jgi:type I restriction enzyme, S subunit